MIDSGEPEAGAAPVADLEALDPFSGHLDFARRHGPNPPTTAADRPGFEPIEPIDTRADKLLDLDELERIASWSGGFKPAREMRPDEYPVEVEDALAEREPQFHLRNIGRAERHADPDNLDEITRDRVVYGLHVEGALVTHDVTYQPPELLGEMNLDAMRRHRAQTRQVLDQDPWERHFCRELKQKWRGPMWRYDPDEHGDLQQ